MMPATNPEFRDLFPDELPTDSASLLMRRQLVFTEYSAPLVCPGCERGVSRYMAAHNPRRLSDVENTCPFCGLTLVWVTTSDLPAYWLLASDPRPSPYRLH